ncbi:MAG: right-handed parallel beta-helix repeat-containing protein, partial [Planctomycetota bacterium]
EAGPGLRGGDGGRGGDGYGGAFYFAADSSPRILSCEIINCRAIGGNGGAGGRGGDGTRLTGMLLGAPGGGDGGNAGAGGNAYGGAMYFEPGCKATIENCIIANCNTTQGEGNTGGDGGDGLEGGDGGGNGGSGSINGTESWYGAMYYGAGCEINVSNTMISNNAASTDNVTQHDWPGGQGGINLASPDDPFFWGAPGSAVSSSTSSLAGSNYYASGCEAELTNCTISNSRAISYATAEGHAGAEYYEPDCTVTFNNCQFTNNRAEPGNGGAQYFSSSCVVDVNLCNFSKNFTGGNGGTHYVDEFCSIKISKAGFTNNWAGSDGGAMYLLHSCTLDVSDSHFTGNSANGSYSRGGGLYWSEGCMITFNNNAFVGNESEFGAAAYWYGDDSSVEIYDCIIKDNGGGFYWGGGSPIIKGCVITGNVAEGRFVPVAGGGGLFCWSSNARIEDCYISRNLATGSGGGVYFGNIGWPILKNCLIEENYATREGGGIISYWSAAPTISNCTIVNNTAYDPGSDAYGRGGGLSCSYESKTNLIDSILWGNTATTGSQIAIGGETDDPNLIQRPAELTVLYCDVGGWQQDPCDPNWIDPNAVYVESGGTLNWGDSNDPNSKPIDEDPNFIYGYYLSQFYAGQMTESNCVDGGSGDASDPNISLDAYTTRTDGANDANRVDMGYHYDRGATGFNLTAAVVGGNGTVALDPNGGSYSQYTIVTLTATPDTGYHVKGWYDDNGVLVSTDRTLEVVMNSDLSFTVEFEQMDSYHIPGQYTSIGAALNERDVYGNYRVGSGDKIILSPMVYYEHSLDFDGRSITVASERPDDPCFVEGTVIDCQGQGRAFIFRGGEGSDTVIDGITIRNGDAVGNSASPAAPHPGFPGSDGEYAYGGAIASFGASSPTISNCIIINCMARGRFAGDGARGPDAPPSPPFPPARGIDGGAGGRGGDGYGGAFYFASKSKPKILGCQIINCRTIGGNGGAGGRGGDGYLVGPIPSRGGGHGADAGDGGNAYGGAMYFEPYCKVTIKGCVIEGSSTTQGEGNIGGDGGNGLNSGAMGGNAGSGSINGTASWYGAIFFGSNCDIAISNTAITDNITNTAVTRNDWPGGTGGFNVVLPDMEALQGAPGATPISSTSSLAPGNYYRSGCKAELTNCTISRNRTDETYGTSGGGGGEYYESYCETKITGCEFANNYGGINGEGGCHYFGSACLVDISDCNFADNLAGGRGGGAQYFGISCVVDINNSNFASNYTWGDGGGVCLLTDCSVNINNSRFTGNFAPSGPGGGIYWDSRGTVRITSSEFIDNESVFGGGLYWYGDGSDVGVYDCVIKNNLAQSHGGGLYWSDGAPTIKGCVIRGNISEGSFISVSGENIYGGGGGIFSWSSDPTIDDCFIWENLTKGSGGGVYFGNVGSPTL